MIVTRPIPAPCRTYCRAAFRRVAGGVLPERGRGMEEINHGRTRTVLTNVRFLLDKGERRCTCGEAVRLPEAEGRAAKRSQEAARGVSALVGGLSKSFQGMRIEEKGHNAHEGDAMVVKPRLLVGVSGDYDFAEVVFDVEKGKCFLFPFRMVWDGKCRLDVNAFRCLVHNEIDFITLDFMLAGRGCSVYRYIAHVNRISSHCKLVEDCVFHKVRPFVLSEVEAGVAEPAICGIVFERGSDVSTAFDIITHCFGYHECVCQIVNVLANGDSVCLHAHDCVECVRDFARVGKTANSAHHDGHKRIKHFIAFETVPFNDIAQINCFVEVCEISGFFRFGLFQHTIRQTAKIKIFIEDRVEIPGFFLELYEFRHAKGLYMYDLASPAKFRGDVGRKHFGVGSGDIYIDVGDLPQCVQNMIEGHIRIFPRFRVQLCEIDPFAQHLVASLNFVDDDEGGFVVIGKHCLNVPFQFDWIEEYIILGLLEVNFQDVVSSDTLVNEMLFEDSPEKVTFPASSNAGYDFHCAIHLCINELPQIFWSFNRHSFTVFGFMGNPMFCKVAILYHNECADVKRWLFKSCENTSFVKCDCSSCCQFEIRSAA